MSLRLPDMRLYQRPNLALTFNQRLIVGKGKNNDPSL